MTPLTKGDRLTDPAGQVWTVSRVYPGGRLNLFHETHSRFRYCRTKDVQTWTRIETAENVKSL